MGKRGENVRIDVVGKVLQRMSVQRSKRSVVLGERQAIIVRVCVMLDFTVGELGDVVQSVPARVRGQQGSVELGLGTYSRSVLK